ncbi:hypothetical protein NAC44_20760 [Allorhizobium sp. BGMRC 0089]|uniref:hypothetical protein n=1 Tax=Allorhizobium sonneratiae TaxID=2934936 RepID=UPI002033CECD|nr:hypothetical protein [Allorhizobium sonneratiae]MCM2294761.1 hypothetical protein [Allorhizobium sonneratiae]
MTKQEEFMWIVQTAILANGINLASREDTRDSYIETYSSTGVRIVMREAIRASRLIPQTMDAADAADEFCIWMFRNHQDTLRKDNPKANVPKWFSR